MIPGANKAMVAEMLAWVSEATSDEERDTRETGVLNALLDGASDEEEARLRKLVETVAAEIKKKKPPEPPMVTLPPKKRRPPVKVYSPERRGYQRASREEGLGAEATGSPFFGDAPPVGERPSTRALEELRRSLKAARPGAKPAR